MTFKSIKKIIGLFVIFWVTPIFISTIFAESSETCEKSSTVLTQPNRIKANTALRDAILMTPVSAFCKQTAKERALTHDLGELGGKKGINEFEKARLSTDPKSGPCGWRDKYSNTKSESPWRLTLYPHPSTRIWAMREVFGQVLGNQDCDASPLNEVTLTKVEDFFNDPNSKSGSHRFPEQAQSPKEFLKRSTPMRQDESKKALAQKAFLCGRYGVLDSLDCMNSLELGFEIMAPTTDELSLPDAITDVFSDPKYVEGARRAAVKILKKIRSSETPKGDLYSDILDSFLELNIEKSRAEEMTWNFIAATQFNGPNSMIFLRPLANKNNMALLFSIGVIGTGQYVLDSRRSGLGQLYSYPPSVSTDCDFGKSYNFWVSAFIARKVTQKLKNERAATNAVWLLHLGYQMLATTGHRDRFQPYTEDTFSVTNNGIRMDMAAASAGAMYGSLAANGNKRNLNIHTALAALMKSADLAHSPMSRDAAEAQWTGTGIRGYQKFMNLFSPDAALDVLKQ